MPSTYHIPIIDQSGVEQALDFDYRHQNKKSLYQDVRVAIKKVFAEKIELIKDLFPDGELTFNVNLEQEKKDGLGLPVGVTNDVAQAQMMSQVPGQPQNPADQEHAMDMAQQQQDAQAKATKEDVGATLIKLKRIL
jgi:ribosomal protein L16/L10AE